MWSKLDGHVGNLVIWDKSDTERQHCILSLYVKSENVDLRDYGARIVATEDLGD